MVKFPADRAGFAISPGAALLAVGDTLIYTLEADRMGLFQRRRNAGITGKFRK